MKAYFNPMVRRFMLSDVDRGLSDEVVIEKLDQLGIGKEEMLRADYYLIDLNKDGNQDVLSSYIYGADGPILRIWLNIESRLDLVVSEPLGIPQLIYEGEEHTELLIYKSGYFGAITSSILSYRFDKSGLSKIQVEFQTATEFPETSNHLSRFETINDEYNLRYQPIVKNEPCGEEMSPENVVCGSKYILLSAGTRGTAYGTSTDDTGRIWWFSVVETQDNRTPLQAGWVSSSFVKKQ